MRYCYFNYDFEREKNDISHEEMRKTIIKLFYEIGCDDISSNERTAMLVEFDENYLSFNEIKDKLEELPMNVYYTVVLIAATKGGDHFMDNFPNQEHSDYFEKAKEDVKKNI